MANKNTWVTTGVLVVIAAIIAFGWIVARRNDSQPEMTIIPNSLPPLLTDNTAIKTFNISGENFKFSQDEIRVKQGDTVRINFSSSTGFHDWVVDEFNASTDQVNPGTPTEVQFVADKAGTFEYYCSVGNHRQMGMVGRLIVE